MAKCPLCIGSGCGLDNDWLELPCPRGCPRRSYIGGSHYEDGCLVPDEDPDNDGEPP